MKRRRKKPEKSHVFDKPRNIKRLLRVLYIVCGVLFAADLVYHRHAEHAWEALLGFYAIYGFVACVVLVLAAKEMRKVLMRKEDYYDMDD
jgi:hypothetical protein